MNKKQMVGVGAILLLLTVFISFFGIIKPTPINNKTTEQVVQKNNVTIAVVNEDVGTVYNGQSVNMATTLLKSFSSQSEYNIEEVSRSIAEKGLESGTYQLMIILPSKFSEDSLALESSNPNKAIFQYQIKSDKPLVTKQAEEAVLQLKSLFNKDLVAIYFLSIINNLQTAQEQMNEVVSNEGSSLNAYRTNLTNPLLGYSERFIGLGNAPKDLLTNYSSFDSQLNQTNEAFTSIMDVNKTYEDEIEKIKILQNTWQQAIMDQQKQLAIYDEQFSKLTVQEQLDTLKVVNDDLLNNVSQASVWQETIDKSQQFNKQIADLVNQLEQSNTAIDQTLTNYETKITAAIEDSINKTNGEIGDSQQVKITLGSYIKKMRETMLSKMDDVLYNGVYYDDNTLEKLGLPASDIQYLKNINAFMNWYATEHKKQNVTMQSQTNVDNHVKQLQQTAINNLQTTKQLSFKNIEGTIKDIQVSVPKNYILKVNGYSVSQKNDTTYIISVGNKNVSDLDVNYHLQPISPKDMSLVDLVEVKAEMLTEETVDVATGTQTIETQPDNSGNNTGNTSQTVKIIKPDMTSKVINRVYTVTNSFSNLLAYQPYEEANALYQDIQHYLEVASLAKAFYDVDLHQGFNGSPESSLFKQTDVTQLKAIIVSLIKDTTISTLKDNLKIPEDKLKQFASLSITSDELGKKIEELRQHTSDLTAQLKSILSETEKVHTTLQEKPIFTEAQLDDNADLITVSLEMNKEMGQLLSASRTLMDNTKDNQNVSKTIQASIEKLSNDVSILEEEGKSLSEKVAELQGIMNEKYSSNQEFLKGFSSVLTNTKVGNRQNDAVYEYLSNPVDASKIQSVLGMNTSKETTTRQDNRTGLLIVLIAYLIALTITYCLQHANKKALQKYISPTQRIDWKNATQPLLFLTLMGTLSGIIIGGVSAYKLGMSLGQGLVFCMIVVTIVLMLTYGLNILLIKLNSIGFMIAVWLLLLYIITATQLLDTYYMNATEFLAPFSPLTYIENSIGGYINYTNNGVILFIVCFVLSIVFGVMNGLIYRVIKTDESDN